MSITDIYIAHQHVLAEHNINKATNFSIFARQHLAGINFYFSLVSVVLSAISEVPLCNVSHLSFERTLLQK